jgi:hypothetical protein
VMGADVVIAEMLIGRILGCYRRLWRCDNQGFMNPTPKPRAILTDPAPIVNGRLEYPSKLLRFAGAKPASHWSVPREIAIAESVFVRVQFMSRRR